MNAGMTPEQITRLFTSLGSIEANVKTLTIAMSEQTTFCRAEMAKMDTRVDKLEKNGVASAAGRRAALDTLMTIGKIVALFGIGSGGLGFLALVIERIAQLVH